MRPLISLLLCISTIAPAYGEAHRPNIVLVMADDQGWGQVSYNGHPQLKTPHLDAMAGSGHPLQPFLRRRASVLTHACIGAHRPESKPDGCTLPWIQSLPTRKTLPAALKRAGYATGHFGKWHLNGCARSGRSYPAD